MNLEGSLDAFGLPDVFALLAMTGKSGGLRVRRDALVPGAPSLEGLVWFHLGRVTGATGDTARQSLVRRVVGSGAVDDGALRAAVARASGGGIGVARALLEAGAVEPELLREAAIDQAVDGIFDLTRWEVGEFGFDPGALNNDDVGVSLDHAWLIAEANARGTAWSEVRAVIPSPDAVLSMPVLVHDDPTISRDEWALIALVDGRRRVGDLVELTGCGQFAVACTLAGLVRRGLLSVRDAAAPDHASVVERRLSLLAPMEISVATPGGGPETVRATPEPSQNEGVPVAAALAAARAAQGLPPSAPMSSPSAPSSPSSPDRTATQEAASRPMRPAARREVVPPRPEPFLPARRPEHLEYGAGSARGGSAQSGSGFAGGSQHSRATSAGGAGAQQSPGPFSGADHRADGMTTTTVTSGSSAMLAVTQPLEQSAGGAGMHTSTSSGSPASAGPGEQGIIERDPAVSRSLLLRLIAGVRGL